MNPPLFFQLAAALWIGSYGLSFAQPTPLPAKWVKFRPLIEKAAERYQQPYCLDCKPLALPELFRQEAANGLGHAVELSETPLDFVKREVTLQNPFTQAEEKGLPLAYSVWYQNRLVTLFEPGQFQCITLPDFTRDLALESRLNSKNGFKTYWLLENRLVARKQGRYWVFNDSLARWEDWKGFNPLPRIEPPKTRSETPFHKIFEDERYLVFSECHGEFGGNLFFCDKTTQHITVAPATCAVTVRREGPEYVVSESLGHMMGSSALWHVRYPEHLSTFLKRAPPFQAGHFVRMGTTQLQAFFKSFGMLIWGSFPYQNRHLHLVYENLLAELRGNRVQVVEQVPQIAFAHNPICFTYPDGTTLINLDTYGKGSYREQQVVVIQENRFTVLTWKGSMPE
jgi:hypothetical protein